VPSGSVFHSLHEEIVAPLSANHVLLPFFLPTDAFSSFPTFGDTTQAKAFFDVQRVELALSYSYE
jgi:hypothetical protein